MFDAIGPHMWAVFACIGFMYVGSALITHGLVGALIGIPVLAAATGALVDIVFYEGTVFPGINLPIGVVAGLIVLALTGARVALSSDSHIAGPRTSFRERLPEVNIQRIVALTLGGVFVLVALVALSSRLDISSSSTSAGFSIATDGLDRQRAATFRRIERFLAK